MWPSSEMMRVWTLSSLGSDLIKAQEATVPLIKGSWVCSVDILKDGKFGNSYGTPILGNYMPSKDCLLYNQIVLKLAASVSGRQFDRTGAFWMGGNELLRFTTAEPSGPNSTTVWEIEKDLSVLRSLFLEQNSWALALDNIVNNIYTGIFMVSLSLDFYLNDDVDLPASLIYPLSASALSYGWFVISSKEDVLEFDLPVLPSNTIKIQLDTFWSAHQDDEFWYFNVPNNIASPSQGIFGGGSFKELSVFIDGVLVGMDWLFPTIYSGGMNPLLWRPVVSIGTFDVPHSSLDLTYSLPLINGENHKISMSLGSEPNQFWFLSSRMLVWTDGEPDYLENNSRSKILSWNLSPTKVHEYSIIDFDKDGDSKNKKYTSITRAENTYSVKSKIFKSDGTWFISEMQRSIGFRNRVVNSDGNSTVLCQLNSYIREIEVRDMGDNSTLVKKKLKEFPLSIKVESITESDLFEFRTTLKLLIKERKHIEDKAGKYESYYHNEIYGDGYFGTIRPGIASHTQNVRFKSPENCYSRFLTALNQSIKSDLIFTSCDDIKSF